MGRLHGHSRGRRRLRHSRRHSRQLGAEFGFTASQLGAISGAGFTGFCFGIIIGGVVADKIGYGKLVFVAFLLHVLSAFVTFAATRAMAQPTAYSFSIWGTFIFAVANGTLEAVANPLVATLFPHNRTHYLNILHASWPAGLVLGGAVGWVLDDRMHVDWKIQLGLFLIPTVVYGIDVLRPDTCPSRKPRQAGLSARRDVPGCRHCSAALVACFLIAPVLRQRAAPFSGSPELRRLCASAGCCWLGRRRS